MAASVKRVVGWFDRLEWVHVYDELYSGDPGKQKHALDRIAVWKSRADKLSVAIECTWELTSAELHYNWAKEEASLIEQDKQLRIIYAMALTRFINLITEKGQNARYAFPVHQLANDLCLPQWMVSLRHDAVHSNLPSMIVLKAGVQTALGWLKVEYWEAQLAEEDPALEEQLGAGARSTGGQGAAGRGTPVPDSEAAEILAQMLEAYTAEYYKLFSEKGSPSNKSKRQKLNPILKDMEQLIASSNREVALGVLLQDGFLLHTAEQLEALGISVKDLLKDDSLRLPSELLPLWDPVLRCLQKLRAIPLLLTLLLLTQNGPALRLRQAVGWVMEILTATNQESGCRGNLLSSTFTEEDSESFTSGRRLLVTCLENPNQYTATLLPHLFSTASPTLSRLQKKMLLKSVRIYTTTNSTREGGTDTTTEGTEIHDIDSLDIVVKPMEWSDCPLGYCPSMPVTYTSLELPEAVNSLGAAGTHQQITRVIPTLCQNNGARAHSGKNNTKNNTKNCQDDEGLEPNSKASMEWSPSELNTMKEQIALF